MRDGRAESQLMISVPKYPWAKPPHKLKKIHTGDVKPGGSLGVFR